MVRSFSKPVSKLSHMANRMAAMDFSERYTHTGHGELEELGQNLNATSAAMETAISDLKTLILLGTVPFNVLKGLVCAVATTLVYKRISPLLKKW